VELGNWVREVEFRIERSEGDWVVHSNGCWPLP